ncbi:MAG: DNA polymerase III subunit delta [Burkholderiales bacterium]|nr:DNA polymerase III subunit delta [Burkholderiales bacterium]
MRFDADQLDQRLRRELAPLYVVFGEELLLALEAADRIRAAALAAGFEERKILIADGGFDWAALREAGQSLSLFASKRVVDLRIPSGKPGKNGADALVDYCQALPEDTVTLVSLPALDRHALASKWFGALEKTGETVHAKAIGRDRLPSWISQRLAQQQQSASRETVAFIAERVEGNLMAAYQEIQKLALLFPPGDLSFDAVKGAVLDVARFDVFELGATILRGDRNHFLRMLDGLRGEGAATPLVLWAIAEEARAMSRVRAIMDHGGSLPQAMQQARVWGTRQKLLPQALHRLDQQQLLAALDKASWVDRMAKGLVKGEVWDALLDLGMTLMPQR